MFLSSIPEEEKIYGIDIQSLTQWHTGLTVYFTTLPSFILTQVSLFDRGILTLDAPTVKLWSTLLPRYATDPKMQKYVDELFLSFEKTLTRKSA